MNIDTNTSSNRISHEVPLDTFGDEWKGYVVRLTGGEDKQGFSMKQGVLAPERKRLLLKGGSSCYNPQRAGERKRKSVRGCIYNYDMAAISCVIVKRGEADIAGLTDDSVANKRLGPKRASKIRKLFNLDKEDDVTKFVIRRDLAANDKHMPDPRPLRSNDWSPPFEFNESEPKKLLLNNELTMPRKLIPPSERSWLSDRRCWGLRRNLNDLDESLRLLPIKNLIWIQNL